MAAGRRGPLRPLRAAAAALLAAAALTACDPGDVAPERRPRFEAPAGPPPSVALVLGSGGPRGFAHVGVLKVLDEAGIKPDLVVGSSVGAFVGALYASGIGGAELERLAYELNMAWLFLDVRMLVGMPGTGLTLQHFLNDRLQGRRLEDLAIPLVAIATRVSDGRLVLFNRGDPGLAIRASSAVPEQFEAVRIGDGRYMDGDETSPVPIRVARSLGARVVIAVDVSAFEEDTPPDVPQEWIEKDRRRARRVALEAPEADVLLHPNIGYYAGHSEDYRRRVIALAEAYTRAQLPAIRAALPAKPGTDPD